jgi:rod shape-determining protein MreD
VTFALMALVLIAGAVLQLLLPAVAVLGHTKPPILLGIVVYYALNRRRDDMFMAALLAGYLQDSLSPIPLGYSSCAYCLAGWGLSSFRHLVMADVGVTYVFFGAVTGFCCEFLLWSVLTARELVVLSPARALWRAQGAGMLGAACALIIFLLVRRLDCLTGNVEEKDDFIGRSFFQRG